MLAMTSKIGIYVPTGYLPYAGVSVFCQGHVWAVLWGKISVSDLIQGRFFCFVLFASVSDPGQMVLL